MKPKVSPTGDNHTQPECKKEELPADSEKSINRKKSDSFVGVATALEGNNNPAPQDDEVCECGHPKNLHPNGICIQSIAKDKKCRCEEFKKKEMVNEN